MKNNGLEKEAKMLNIWIESWALRQAIRFTLNGCDYVVVIKMAKLAIKEMREMMH